MSLKDWKIKQNSSGLMIFEKGTKEIHIFKRVNWIVYIPVKGFKNFKTKPQALAYARSYMRKN